MKFYATQKLGPKRSLTPEGYLLCEDVPVARTGDMVYAPGEVPIEAGPDGLIHITRDADEVFRTETMASCEGKPVTVNHPAEFVTPKNFKALSVGLMVNVRRGTGLDNDLMIADLMVTDQEGIDAILNDGIEQVSLGYDADYVQVSPGRGAQRAILVNHVALVPRGRCGPRCEIGDEDTVMTTTKKPNWLDGLKAFIKDAESESETEAEKEARLKKEKEDAAEKESAKTGDAIALILKKLTTMDADIQAMKKEKETSDEETEEEKEARLKKEKEAKTGDEVVAAANSVATPVLSEQDVILYTGDSIASTILARAEILSPGIRLHTVDAKASTKDAAAHLCACQRRALAAAHKTDDGKAVLAPFVGVGTVDFDNMAPVAVNAIFTGAAEAMRAKNNAVGKGATIDTKVLAGKMSVTDSIRTMQANADKLWAGTAHSK